VPNAEIEESRSKIDSTQGAKAITQRKLHDCSTDSCILPQRELCGAKKPVPEEL